MLCCNAILFHWVDVMIRDPLLFHPIWLDRIKNLLIVHMWWARPVCFTPVVLDRQPPFRTSCLMLRLWLWWSAVSATIWITEALTMHFKPSKWASAWGEISSGCRVNYTLRGFLSCRTGSALALLYGTSATLEHHHFNHAVMILQSEVRLSSLFNNSAQYSEYSEHLLMFF